MFNTYEEAWAIAGPRLEQAAKETVEDLREAAGVGGDQIAVSEPWLMEGEGDDGYYVNVNYGDLDDEEESIDISFKLIDAGPYDGYEEGDEEWGVNITVDIVHYGGAILGGFTPYNYTPEVWTNDVDELKRRLTAIDPMALADFIREDAIPRMISKRGNLQFDANARYKKGLDDDQMERIAKRLKS